MEPLRRPVDKKSNSLQSYLFEIKYERKVKKNLHCSHKIYQLQLRKSLVFQNLWDFSTQIMADTAGKEVKIINTTAHLCKGYSKFLPRPKTKNLMMEKACKTSHERKIMMGSSPNMVDWQNRKGTWSRNHDDKSMKKSSFHVKSNKNV